MADEPEACSADTFDSAFTKAFLKTDEEFGKADNAALVGTTAVVALVGDRQLYIGNCGVLQRPAQNNFTISLVGLARLHGVRDPAICRYHTCVPTPISNFLHRIP